MRSASQGKLSGDALAKFDLAKAIVTELLPDITDAFEEWVLLKSALGPAVSQASKVVAWVAPLKASYDRVGKLKNIVKKIQANPLNKFINRADELRREVESYWAITKRRRAALPSNIKIALKQANKKPATKDDFASSLGAALDSLDKPSTQTTSASARGGAASSLEAALNKLGSDSAAADSGTSSLASALDRLGAKTDEQGSGSLNNLLNQVEGNAVGEKMANLQAEDPFAARLELRKQQVFASLKKGDYARALDAIDKIRALGGDLPASLLYFEGKAALETGDFSRALGAIEAFFNAPMPGKTRNTTRRWRFILK